VARKRSEHMVGDGRCPACGKALIGEGSFCPFCGAPVPRHEMEQFCAFCGIKLRPQARFCAKCGQTVHGAASSDPFAYADMLTIEAGSVCKKSLI